MGLVLGFGGALLLSRLMQSLLFGVASSDLFTFAAVAGVLLRWRSSPASWRRGG